MEAIVFFIVLYVLFLKAVMTISVDEST